jgi:hypothetical protein
MYRTFYFKDTGKLIISRQMSDSAVTERLALYTDQGCLNVACTEIDKFKVNLSSLELEPITITEDLQHWLRLRRNAELQMCDWTQGADSPLTDSKKTEWQTYRQSLRDLPTTYSSITSRDDVTWPSKPE